MKKAFIHHASSSENLKYQTEEIENAIDTTMLRLGDKELLDWIAKKEASFEQNVLLNNRTREFFFDLVMHYRPSFTKALALSQLKTKFKEKSGSFDELYDKFLKLTNVQLFNLVVFRDITTGLNFNPNIQPSHDVLDAIKSVINRANDPVFIAPTCTYSQLNTILTEDEKKFLSPSFFPFIISFLGFYYFIKEDQFFNDIHTLECVDTSSLYQLLKDSTDPQLLNLLDTEQEALAKLFIDPSWIKLESTTVAEAMRYISQCPGLKTKLEKLYFVTHSRLYSLTSPKVMHGFISKAVFLEKKHIYMLFRLLNGGRAIPVTPELVTLFCTLHPEKKEIFDNLSGTETVGDLYIKLPMVYENHCVASYIFSYLHNRHPGILVEAFIALLKDTSESMIKRLKKDVNEILTRWSDKKLLDYISGVVSIFDTDEQQLLFDGHFREYFIELIMHHRPSLVKHWALLGLKKAFPQYLNEFSDIYDEIVRMEWDNIKTLSRLTPAIINESGAIGKTFIDAFSPFLNKGSPVSSESEVQYKDILKKFSDNAHRAFFSNEECVHAIKWLIFYKVVTRHGKP